MEYSASIEWWCEHVGVIRLHPHPDGQVGDDWTWCATIKREGQRVYVGAVSRPIGKAALIVVGLELHRQGMTIVDYKRHGSPRQADLSRKLHARPEA